VPVEFHRRTLSLFYYVAAICFVILGILSLMVALGEAIASGGWSSKTVGVLEWALAGVVWICSSPAMWAQGRKYRDNLVRLTDFQIFIHSAGGKDFTIPYSLIRAVDFNPARRARLLTIHTPETTYTFDQRAVPGIGKVAELLRQRIVTP
jgi:hypothetical protein